MRGDGEVLVAAPAIAEGEGTRGGYHERGHLRLRGRLGNSSAKSPVEPLKSRFHRACPGSDSSAGCSTRAISPRVAASAPPRARIARGASGARRACGCCATAGGLSRRGSRSARRSRDRVTQPRATIPCTRLRAPMSRSECPAGVLGRRLHHEVSRRARTRGSRGPCSRVLSGSPRVPCFFATRGIAAKSCTSNVCEPGLSRYTTRLLGFRSAAIPSPHQRIVVRRLHAEARERAIAGRRVGEYTESTISVRGSPYFTHTRAAPRRWPRGRTRTWPPDSLPRLDHQLWERRAQRHAENARTWAPPRPRRTLLDRLQLRDALEHHRRCDNDRQVHRLSVRSAPPAAGFDEVRRFLHWGGGELQCERKSLEHG